MVFGCANNVIKIIIFGLNVVICLGGAAIFGVSVAAIVDKESIVKLAHNEAFSSNSDVAKEIEEMLSSSHYKTSMYILAGIGAFLFLVGFLGCVGTACENSCLLGIFFVVLLMILLVQLSGTIYFMVNKGSLKDKTKAILLKLEKKNVDPFTSAYEAKNKCCGVDGPTGTDTCKAGTKGCWNILYGQLESEGVIAIIISFFVIAIEALTLLFACVLFKAFKESDRYYA